MHIAESNPVVFCIKFVEAVKEGWKLKDVVEGRPSHAFLHSIQMFKGFSPEVIRLTSETHVIEEYDSFEFLKKLQNAILNDFELDVKSIRWDTVGRKSCVLTNPNFVEPKTWSKEQLEEMPYEQLKKVAKQLDCFHRAKDIMINRVIEKQKEGK